MTLLDKTCTIIFANEGNYSSINADDNGAVSIGRIQWHAERAHKLLKSIIRHDMEGASHILPEKLYNDIIGATPWTKRIFNEIECITCKKILAEKYSKIEQDKLMKKDVQSYINAVIKNHIYDENTIVLLSDVCNQGGTSACNRIARKTYDKYMSTTNTKPIIDCAMQMCFTDSVFSKYKQRRLDVYRKLTGKSYTFVAPYIEYKIKPGDNLISIADRYGTKVSKLVEDNDIKNPSLILVGDVLKIYR